MSKVTIILDDEENTVEIPENGPAILDVAIEKDLDPPYSCRGGVCTTCRAKVLEGQVEMESNYALTDEEVEEGYVLTCQSHPKSEVVVVSYDE